MPDAIEIEKGIAYVFFAYDVGMSIDLSAAQRTLTAAERPETIRHKRRTPEYFGFENVPVRVAQGRESTDPQPTSLGRFETSPIVDLVLFEFGAVGVKYSIPLAGPLSDLLDLSDKLYENAALLADARSRVERLLHQINANVTKPHIAAFVEDYVIFHIERVASTGSGIANDPTPAHAPSTSLTASSVHAAAPSNASFIRHVLHDASGLTARILRAERSVLSADEVTDALAARICYTPTDLLIIDWNSAILVGDSADTGMDDVIPVLEYANVELLEMRYLDHGLDNAMERISASQAIRGFSAWWPGFSGRRAGQRSLESIAELQIDGVRLFEEVNNALKLLGDQYLARVYRLASGRLHLPEWDAAILRKLDTIESVYQKMNDFRTARRLETLEWIVIALIAFEVVLSLVRG